MDWRDDLVHERKRPADGLPMYHSSHLRAIPVSHSPAASLLSNTKAAEITYHFLGDGATVMELPPAKPIVDALNNTLHEGY